MGLLDYVRDFLVVKMSSTSSTNNNNKNRGHAPHGHWSGISHILSHLIPTTHPRRDTLIIPVSRSQGHSLAVAEPHLNQVVWFQSQALNSSQNKQHQEDAQRVNVPSHRCSHFISMIIESYMFGPHPIYPLQCLSQDFSKGSIPHSHGTFPNVELQTRLSE